MHCGSMGCMCAARCELPLLNSLSGYIGPALQVIFAFHFVANTPY